MRPTCWATVLTSPSRIRIVSFAPTLDAIVKAVTRAERQEADGVIRALRHLNGLSVDGQDLLVKCSAATQQYADEYLARKVSR